MYLCSCVTIADDYVTSRVRNCVLSQVREAVQGFDRVLIRRPGRRDVRDDSDRGGFGGNTLTVLQVNKMYVMARLLPSLPNDEAV